MIRTSNNNFRFAAYGPQLHVPLITVYFDDKIPAWVPRPSGSLPPHSILHNVNIRISNHVYFIDWISSNILDYDWNKEYIDLKNYVCVFLLYFSIRKHALIINYDGRFL